MRLVYAGISGTLNPETNKYQFKVDFEDNTDDDVVQFLKPYFHQSVIDENTYWFGYCFNDGQSNPRRDEFIEFIKHVQPERLVDPEDEWSGWDYDDKHLTETELRGMVGRSLSRLHLDNYSVDTIIYPESKSGNLVKMIVWSICHYINRANEITTAELKKASPNDIVFDYSKFNADLQKGKITVPDFVTEDYIDNMMKTVNESSSFSLRKNIKPVVLRNYVSNFYSARKSEHAVTAADVVLVVDDFGTTGTTIKEIVRNIRELNADCEIYIFTLMGNKKVK